MDWDELHRYGYLKWHRTFWSACKAWLKDDLT